MKTDNKIFALECQNASLKNAIHDVMFILSEIESNEEDTLSGIWARCAYARLQQLIRESK